MNCCAGIDFCLSRAVFRVLAPGNVRCRGASARVYCLALTLSLRHLQLQRSLEMQPVSDDLMCTSHLLLELQTKVHTMVRNQGGGFHI